MACTWSLYKPFQSVSNNLTTNVAMTDLVQTVFEEQ